MILSDFQIADTPLKHATSDTDIILKRLQCKYSLSLPFADEEGRQKNEQKNQQV